MEKKLGKIQKATFGACGYQEMMFGARFTLGGECWGVGDSICGGWNTERSERTEWSEEDRIKAHGKMCVELSKIMKLAKVNYFHELKNKPVEAIFEDRILKSWRILSEVI